MKLWMVEGQGGGVSFNVVRAVDEEDARLVAKAGRSATVTELKPKGQEAILWSYDYSPDTPRDD